MLSQLYCDLMNKAIRETSYETMTSYTPFIARRGSKYSAGGLMVIGRAPNGWDDDWPDEGTTGGTIVPGHLDALMKKALDRDQDPMNWVLDRWNSLNDYKTKRSAFWRVAKSIHAAIYGPSEQWANQIAWSNLYKLSPRAGLNPPGRLCDIQIKNCRLILAEEISRFKPGNLVFMTGTGWGRYFWQQISDEPCPSDFPRVTIGARDYPICATPLAARFGFAANCVFVPHPQGKKEADLCKAAVQYLNSC